MNFFRLPAPPNTPPIGMRVDFWDPATNSFPANSSIFFYQAGTQVRLNTSSCPYCPDCWALASWVFDQAVPMRDLKGTVWCQKLSKECTCSTSLTIRNSQICVSHDKHYKLQDRCALQLIPHTVNFVLQPGYQIPPLYGSKMNVPTSNFYYVNLASFLFNPRDPNYNAPPSWNGKLSIIFMLENGPAFSGAQAYITQQPVTPSASSAQTAGR